MRCFLLLMVVMGRIEKKRVIFGLCNIHFMFYFIGRTTVCCLGEHILLLDEKSSLWKELITTILLTRGVTTLRIYMVDLLLPVTANTTFDRDNFCLLRLNQKLLAVQTSDLARLSCFDIYFTQQPDKK